MKNTPDDRTLLEWMRAHAADPHLIEDEALRSRVETALADPNLRRQMEALDAFDGRFRNGINKVPVPSGLLTRILVGHGVAAAPQPAPAGESAWGRWFHYGTFGSAAVAIALLALAITFFPTAQTQVVAGDQSFFVEDLVHSIELAVATPGGPVQRIDQLSEAHTFLTTHGYANPGTPPASLEAEQSFACRVFESQGMKIAMICFQTDDGIVHLISFPAKHIPNREILTSSEGKPVLRSVGEHSVASWVRDGEVQMLLSRMELAKLAARL